MDARWLADKNKSIERWLKKPPIGGCLHGKQACANPIGSHLVSRCILDLIALNGHVIQLSLPPVKKVQEYKESWDDSLLDMVDKKLGVKKQASTFPGFCSKCDREVFRDIDTPEMNVTRGNIQLLSYRAISQATAIKYQMFAAMMAVKENDRAYQKSMMMGVEFMTQYIPVSGMQEEIRLDLNGSKDTFCHFVIRVAGTLPFATAGGFHPYISANGRRFDDRTEVMTLSVIPQKNQSIVSFTWKECGGKNSELLLKSIKKIPKEIFADWLFRYCLEVSETVFISPEWWDGQKETDRNFFRQVAKPYSSHPKGIELNDLYKPTPERLLSFKRRSVIKNNYLDEIMFG